MNSGVNGGDGCRGLSIFGDIDTLTVAAHELKSPLALIRQLTLELEASASNPDNQKNILEQIRLTSEKALRLTSNLTKAEQLQSSLFETSSLHPSAVCTEVFQEILPLYRANNRDICMSTKSRTQLVVANKDILRRVLLNFADNALHYSGDGGVVELFTQLIRKDGMVRFGVRDYGPALPASLWNDILTRPSSPQVVHDRPESSGLGLVIASRFAETIGGKIGAIRHRDGASFYVDMPISKQLVLL